MDDSLDVGEIHFRVILAQSIEGLGCIRVS